MSIILQEFCFSLVVGGQRRGNELSCQGGRNRLADVQHYWWCKLSGYRQPLLAPLKVLERLVLVAFYFSPDGGLILVETCIKMAAEAVPGLLSSLPKSPKGYHVNQTLPQLPPLLPDPQHRTAAHIGLHGCVLVKECRPPLCPVTLFVCVTCFKGRCLSIHSLAHPLRISFSCFLRVSACMRRGNEQLAPLELLHKLALYHFLVCAQINFDFCQFYYSDSQDMNSVL